MKQVIKSAGDKAKQVAASNAKQIARELLEIPKQAAAEAVGAKPAGPSSSGELSESSSQTYDPSKTQEQVKQRLDYLEQELTELKRKREMEKQQEEYDLAQKQKQEEEERQKRMQEITSPPKRKLHMPVFGQKKAKGTGEQISSKR